MVLAIGTASLFLWLHFRKSGNQEPPKPGLAPGLAPGGGQLPVYRPQMNPSAPNVPPVSILEKSAPLGGSLAERLAAGLAAKG